MKEAEQTARPLSKRFKNLKLVNEMLDRGYEYVSLLNLSWTNTELNGYLSLMDMGEVLTNIDNGNDIICAS